MKFLNLANFARMTGLVLSFTILTALPLMAQNSNTANSGTTTSSTQTTVNTATPSNAGAANSSTGNTTVNRSSTTTATSSSTPVQTSGSTNRVVEKTEVKTEQERSFPWGLLGLLGLAGLIPRPRKQVEVAEFRDTRPREVHTEVRTETVDKSSTTNNRTNN